MKLYELTQNYQNLLELLDNPDVPREQLEEGLNEVQENIEDKAVNIAKLIKNMDAEASALKDEEKRLAERRKSLENRVSNMKEYLQGQLKEVNIPKIKTSLFTISIQKNPPSVNVLDEKKLPENFFIIKKDIDKKSILEQLKSGQIVEGAEIKQSESLRIR